MHGFFLGFFVHQFYEGIEKNGGEDGSIMEGGLERMIVDCVIHH